MTWGIQRIQSNMLLAMRNTVWRLLIVCRSHWVIISSMKRRFTVTEYTHALESISSIQLAFLFFYFWIKPSTTQPRSNYGNSLIACRCPLGVSVGKMHDSAMMQTVLILANVNVSKGKHKYADKKKMCKKFCWWCHCLYLPANVAHVCWK